MGGGIDPSSIADPSIANSALQPYGLQLPTHTNPFLFFNDRQQDGTPTWAGNHPRAAKAVEGAMIGLTTEGGNTIGQSISNVAKTALGIPGLYRQNQAAQMQAPFDQARQIGALQDDDMKRQLMISQTFHNWASGKELLDKKPPTKAYIPMTVNGQVQGYNPETNAFEPTANAPAAQEDNSGVHRVGTPPKPTADAGGIPKWVRTREERAAFFEYSQKGGEFDEQGQPKDKLGFNRLVTTYVGRNAAASGGGSTNARKTVDLDFGSMSDVQKAQHTAKEKAVTEAEQELQRAQKAPLDPSTGLAGRKQAVDTAQQGLNSAKQDRQNFLNGLGGSRNSKNNQQPGQPSRPTTTIHPDGRIEIK